MMFVVFCPTHGTRMLMTRRNVIGFANGLDGPVLRWRCLCGHEGFLDREGSHPDETTARAADDPVDHADSRACEAGPGGSVAAHV